MTYGIHITNEAGPKISRELFTSEGGKLAWRHVCDLEFLSRAFFENSDGQLGGSSYEGPEIFALATESQKHRRDLRGTARAMTPSFATMSNTQKKTGL